MKQQAIQYLALDVHQSTVVACLRDAQGAITMRSTVRTEAQAIRGLVRAAGTRVHVAFEEGTQAQWLYDVLQPHAERVVVCNTRGRSETTPKNDRIDAAALSEILRLGSLKSVSVFRQSGRKQWLAKLENRGARVRAESLLAQLDTLLELRPAAKRAMISEARRQPGWRALRSIPFLGEVRVAQILAIVATPFRFRTKRQLWPYVGLAVVTRSSADEEFVGGRLRRRRRAPLTRGLNRNHNPLLKSIFKGAANAAAAKAGPLKDVYDASVARGVREELAKVTLARKIVSIALRLWKQGELWNAQKVTMTLAT